MTNFTIGQKVRIVRGGVHEGEVGRFNGIPTGFIGNVTDNSPCKVELNDNLEIDTFFFNLESVDEEDDCNIQIGSKVCVIYGRFRGNLGKVRMATKNNNSHFLVDLLDNISVEIHRDDMVVIVGPTLFAK